MKEIEKIVLEFCRENDIEVRLSYDMPAGYETAYGTYDVTINTLFLNTAILQNAPQYEVLFYLFHELRHAMQYLCPMKFDDKIKESILYVILYNGTCFKLVNNEWKECALPGDESYFTRAYMNLPYEIDANTFAYEKAREICGDSAELKELYDFWIPKDSFDYEEHRKLFHRIDEKLIHRTRRTADLGNRNGQYELAHFCEDGIGVEQDMEQAIFWYRKAALQDHDLAIEKCKELGVDFNAPTIDREVIRKALQCRIYPLGYLERYKYTVICTSYDGKWILSRHKKRNTWETQGGHIEDGETPLECAKRELFEESGIRDADIYPVCDYWGFNSQACSNGMVFLAVVHSLGELPESEMKEIKIFDALPQELTYPQTSPKLYAEAEKLLKRMNKTIKTERLILRPLTTDDAADMFEWTSDPVVNRYMPYSLNKDISQTIDYLSSIPDEANEFAFCLKSTGKVIGSGGISFDPDRNSWELGYNLNRAYWGCGYATEAAKAMIKWAYTTLGARDFACNHANANEASRKVILKCGFTFDHYGQYSRFDGSETFDASFYVMHLD